ncbi:uncharacterized protein FOBCDRAFT_232538 [Fusarium oxysporum Fo47]|uniref:uncharacterized protein n=1 Tax=Fusarium oxysporum Fo47 TaxID=660027 RepID=UPI002869B7CB|nr:uncharacterized protein FOBCDRAFT_232538 [Fusarium oxysporum Fo47]WJG36983.1 hypothetical protein FOBCDRAFT_232538 [Fusarium oxysporum Fo47]
MLQSSSILVCLPIVGARLLFSHSGTYSSGKRCNSTIQPNMILSFCIYPLELWNRFFFFFFRLSLFFYASISVIPCRGGDTR